MLKILFPTYSDIDQIGSLNKRYLISHLTEPERHKGFIRIQYCKEELERIIDHKEIVVAAKNDKIFAYYLIGRLSESPLLEYQINKAKSLSDASQIPFEKIGYGCQVCIDEPHRNNGLFKSMLITLSNAVSDKYSHLLCSVSNDNIVSMKTHLNNGWKIFDSFESSNCLTFETSKSLK